MYMIMYIHFFVYTEKENKRKRLCEIRFELVDKDSPGKKVQNNSNDDDALDWGLPWMVWLSYCYFYSNNICIRLLVVVVPVGVGPSRLFSNPRVRTPAMARQVDHVFFE
jgi:hypothetical protein